MFMPFLMQYHDGSSKWVAEFFFFYRNYYISFNELETKSGGGVRRDGEEGNTLKRKRKIKREILELLLAT